MKPKKLFWHDNEIKSRSHTAIVDFEIIKSVFDFRYILTWNYGEGNLGGLVFCDIYDAKYFCQKMFDIEVLKLL